MRYKQAKPLVDKLMDIAVLFHGSPLMLRDRLYAAVDEFLPNMDEACLERGCPAFDAREVDCTEGGEKAVQHIMEAFKEDCTGDRYEHKTYSMAQFYVEEGMYSIEELEELVVELKAVKKMQDAALNRAVKPVEESDS